MDIGYAYFGVSILVVIAAIVVTRVLNTAENELDQKDNKPALH